MSGAIATTGEGRTHRPRARFRFVDTYAAREGLDGEEPAPRLTPRVSIVATRKDDNSRKRFDPNIELELVGNSVGDHIWFGRYRINNRIQTTHLAAESRYVLRAEVANGIYGAVEFDRTGKELSAERSDLSDITLALPPGPAYPFPGVEPNLDPEIDTRPGRGPTIVRGSVHQVDGAGMSGVRVRTTFSVNEIEAETEYPQTDQSGGWVLVLTERFSPPIEQRHLTLRFELPDGGSVDVDEVPIVSGRQTSHTQTTLRGAVQNAKGLGLAGVILRCESDPESLTSSDAEGDWTLRFPLDRHLTTSVETTLVAVMPNGQTETRPVRIEPRSVTNVPTIHFEEP